MDVLYKMGAVLGLLAFLQVSAISAKIRRMERSERENPHLGRSGVDDMRKILASYIGKEVSLDFYDEEEEMDLLCAGKHEKTILLDIDEKWAMIRFETPKKQKDKLIRISSIKGVSFQE